MDPTLIREYETYEERHWWSVARRQILHAMLDQYVPGAAVGRGRWLDVGCGAGVVLETYTGFAERIGAELDRATVERARNNGRDVRHTELQWDFSKFGQFDCITLFDVLEHVEHERPALNAVCDSLKVGGICMITVPALMSLWSDHDVVCHHFRRYRAGELRERFADDQWELLRLTYFSTMLFPVIWSVRQVKRLARKFSRGSIAPPKHDIKFGHPVLDRTLEFIFRLEKPILKRFSLPIGSSILIVLRKKTAGIERY